MKENLDRQVGLTIDEKMIDQVIKKYFDGTDRALRRARRNVEERKAREAKEDQLDWEEEMIRNKITMEEQIDQIEQKEMTDRYAAEETKKLCETAELF